MLEQRGRVYFDLLKPKINQIGFNSVLSERNGLYFYNHPPLLVKVKPVRV